jgi:transcriptional regulator with XRE-family HTH domain
MGPAPRRGSTPADRRTRVLVDPARFEAARARARLSVQALAVRAHVATSTIRRIRRGERILTRSLRALAEVLGVEPDSLLVDDEGEGEGEPSSTPASRPPA